MGDAYQELRANADDIADEVYEEERRFHVTLERGLLLIADELSLLHESGQTRVPGKFAFELYDTYGFPLDLTQDIFREDGYEVDVAEFERLMTAQRERGRAARTFAWDTSAGWDSSFFDTSSEPISRFTGQQSLEAESTITGSRREAGDKMRVVTTETPFYPEGGGQVGDRGVIETASGAIFEVTDTRRHNGAIVHVGRLLRGDPAEFERGCRVVLKVDRERRTAAMLNHSATHLLHYALREVLGSRVHQAGSLVEPARLRFDFAHQGRVAEGDLLTIEEEVNARIRENAAVTTEEMAYDDALKAGALAFFGDKYGDRVRVVRMGDFSIELCGGTHTDRTGDVGIFKLEAESAVAAGVRRIEAATGQGAIEAIRRRERILAEIGEHLGARDEAALERIQRLLAREKELEKKFRALEQKLVAGGAGGEEESVSDREGVKIVTRKVAGVEAGALREMADRLRAKYRSAVVAIGSELDGKVALVVAVTPDLAGRIKAGDVIKKIAPIVGGSGGGRPDFAQAGGRDATKLDEALRAVGDAIG